MPCFIISTMRIIILILIFVNLITLFAAPINETTEIEPVVRTKQNETNTSKIVFSGVSGEKTGKINIPTLGIENEPLYYLATLENLKKGVCMDGPEAGWQIVGEKGRGDKGKCNKEKGNKEKSDTGTVRYKKSDKTK